MLGQQSPALNEAGAFPDSPDQTRLQILFRMGHRHGAGLGGVSEVMVAAIDSCQFPAVPLQFLDQCSAIHLPPLVACLRGYNNPSRLARPILLIPATPLDPWLPAKDNFAYCFPHPGPEANGNFGCLMLSTYLFQAPDALTARWVLLMGVLSIAASDGSTGLPDTDCSWMILTTIFARLVPFR